MRELHEVRWAGMTDPEIAAARDAGAVAAVPVGAIEQHGIHLPSDTDTSLVTSITLGAARAAKPLVVVAPTLAYGLSPYHADFPSTISIRLSTLLTVLADIVDGLAASGFSRIVLVNGHGGNSAPLRALVSELVAEGKAVAAIDYWKPSEPRWQAMLKGPLKALGHGCELETALQLAVSGQDSRRQTAIRATARGLPARMDPPWVEEGSRDPIVPFGAAWSPIFRSGDCGYTGAPAEATVENGNAILAVVIEGLAQFFAAFAESRLKTGGP